MFNTGTENVILNFLLCSAVAVGGEVDPGGGHSDSCWLPIEWSGVLVVVVVVAVSDTQLHVTVTNRREGGDVPHCLWERPDD